MCCNSSGPRRERGNSPLAPRTWRVGGRRSGSGKLEVELDGEGRPLPPLDQGDAEFGVHGDLYRAGKGPGPAATEAALGPGVTPRRLDLRPGGIDQADLHQGAVVARDAVPEFGLAL